jgi:hypothetical protein
MANIDDLGLPEDAVDAVDYDAPESGSFPPSLKPGVYQFLFKLEDDPWGEVEMTVDEHGNKKKFFQVTHIAVTTVQEPEVHDVELRYQRVNFYKHPKMPNSSGGELLRALNLRIHGGYKAIAQALAEVDQRISYSAVVGWKAYCKTDQIEFSTSARKKKIKSGDQYAWPKAVDGVLPEMVECPKCKTKIYAQPEITHYKLPGDVAESHMPAAQATAPANGQGSFVQHEEGEAFTGNPLENHAQQSVRVTRATEDEDVPF